MKLHDAHLAPVPEVKPPHMTKVSGFSHDESIAVEMCWAQHLPSVSKLAAAAKPQALDLSERSSPM